MNPTQKISHAAQNAEANPQKAWARSNWNSEWSADHGRGEGSVLETLRRNMDRLGELHSRLDFLMTEIRSLIRKY